MGLWLPFLLKKPSAVQFIIPWRNSLKCDKTPLEDEIPWITFEAKKWMDDFLNKDMVVFEWGSGGSTIYLAKRVKQLVSVENDRKWYNLVIKSIEKNNISNLEYILKEPEKITDKQIYKQGSIDYFSSAPAYKYFSFKEYCKVIDSFPNENFDLVIVDGRARPSCIFHSFKKVKSGGFLMLDNSEREEYEDGKKLLATWELKNFFGPGPYNRYFWQTSIWKRP